MELTKRLYVGAVLSDGTRINTVELLPTNGIVEKIFTNKIPDSPFSWMGNVITAVVTDMNGEVVAEKAREYYRKNNSISIPECIRCIPIADVNSLILEIHRTLWQNLIEKQSCVCANCGNMMIVDIDLDRIEMPEEDLLKADANISHLQYKLKTPFVYHARTELEKRLYSELDGKLFNFLEFRIPTLGDALRNEKNYKDTILFWRKIAIDCLMRVTCVEEDGITVTDELPIEAIKFYGVNYFDDNFSAPDLKALRAVLREELPSIPFFYEERCVHCHRMTPVTIEPSSFFSD